MPLKAPLFTRSRTRLKILINQFNKIPENDVIQRLFYLHKIHYLVSSVPVDKGLFQWIFQSDADPQSWQAHLLTYGINPDGSFFLKGIQFAKAVAMHMENQEHESTDLASKDIYKLMQERDALLKSDLSFDESKKRFIAISYHLHKLSEKDINLKKNLDDHTQILDLAKEKIRAIKGLSDLRSSAYMTTALDGRHVNNFNYKFKMRGWHEDLVFRVEDRSDLSFEQELHSYPVSKYFANDVALFMMQFKDESNRNIEYKPVVLSQFANQGSLLHVAQKLKGEQQSKITSVVKYYFNQINDFCIKLKEANTYHPDIKLSNFLVHNNKLLVSDRKAFIRDPNPRVETLRATPRYAPPEYVNCLDEDYEDFIQPKAHRTFVNIEQLMSFELGMALKEFLILTQVDELPDDFEEQQCRAFSYFQKPSQSIINLSLLIEELTRPEEGKRLSIEQFQRLIPYIHHKTNSFYDRLEKELPASTLGIKTELKEIIKLLKNNKLNRVNFLEKANSVFIAISERTPREPRLNIMAERLATKCYRTYSEKYFSSISQSIETMLLDKDWTLAPWYRKLAHILSFGYFRVDRITPVEEVTIKLDFKDPLFRTHFISFEFLPVKELDSLGKIEGENFKNYFLTHLDEIRAFNSESSSQAEDFDEIDQPFKNSEKKVNKEDIKENQLHSTLNERSNRQVASLSVKKEAESRTTEDAKAPEKPSGTVVINEKKQDDFPTSYQLEPKVFASKTEEKAHNIKQSSAADLEINHRFFAASKSADNGNPPLIRKRSIRRVSSTLFRGEHSGHRRKIEHRPTIEDIFAPLLPQDKSDEQLSTTKMMTPCKI